MNKRKNYRKKLKIRQIRQTLKKFKNEPKIEKKNYSIFLKKHDSKSKSIKPKKSTNTLKTNLKHKKTPIAIKKLKKTVKSAQESLQQGKATKLAQNVNLKPNICFG